MKYDPLRIYLENLSVNRIQLSFAEIATIIGLPLPKSAFTYREWWSNQKDTTRRPQAAAWLEAGFKVDEVDFRSDSGTVIFVRK